MQSIIQLCAIISTAGSDYSQYDDHPNTQGNTDNSGTKLHIQDNYYSKIEGKQYKMTLNEWRGKVHM
jgi:uncharacterized membrane protein